MPEGADLLGQGHAAVVELPLDDAAAGVQQFAQVKVGVQHLHGAAFHLGHVQHIVDEGQQVAGRTAHLDQAVFHAGLVVKVGFGNIQHAHNAVDGGADIVGHIGEELGLGLAGFLGLVQGGGHLEAEAACPHQQDGTGRHRHSAYAQKIP